MASDRELKEEAQRAFQSYLKSIFLMKDKNIFDVTSVDTVAFAASLGLVVPPRVRFLQKHLRNNKTETKQESENKESLALINSNDSDGELSFHGLI